MRVETLAFLTALCLAAGAPPLFADTLYLKDKTELKGVIVEENAERYLLSTIGGEKTVQKGLVESVKYDDREQSYYQLGRDLQRVGRLREALEAYQTAVKLRPDFRAASEAAFNVQRLLWLDEEGQVESEIQQKKALLQQQGQAVQGAAKSGDAGSLFLRFEKRFGVALRYGDGRAVFTGVQPGSPAAAAGVREEDLLYSVWGDPVAQLSPDAIATKLNSGSKETELAIERTVQLDGSRSGVELALGYDGLRISKVESRSPAAEHLQAGDTVSAINGQITRYMSLAKAQEAMAKGKVTLKIQRGIVLREPASAY
jgi:membrane-associated protease RseP (regulator of RpoE activity)